MDAIIANTDNICISDNEVDWSIWSSLNDNDWHIMLPGKVGIVAKIKLLLKSSVHMPFIVYYVNVLTISCMKYASPVQTMVCAVINQLNLCCSYTVSRKT